LKKYNILFLCKHNASRSIIGEVLANTNIGKKFVGYSAGSEPAEQISIYAQEIAQECGYPVERLRCKNWQEFAQYDSIKMDIIITLNDDSKDKSETISPYWPGNPIIATWNFDDPSLVDGSDEIKRRAYKKVKIELYRRLDILASLPSSALTQEILELIHTDQLGHTD
jgi:protein-tyrosine-phosphatase